MTEQQQTPTVPDRLTESEAEDTLARIERNYRESLDRANALDKAWQSSEARAIRELVRGDGNVDWNDFVTHCGGIMNVVALVDQDGHPDHDRIVPLIDELFAKSAVTEYAGGMTMTRKPKNRPFKPRRPQAVAFPGDGLSVREAERLLEQAQQAEANNWSRSRR